MKFLDLFAGIGGFRLGMEQAGHECVGYVEWDKFARKSYEAIHNTEGEWTAYDITSVTDDDIRKLRGRGRIDVICGGFPCQAFSVAGKRGGFDDTRGTLFFEIVRIANIIRPQYLFLENVKGLLNHDKGNTFETILRTLDELGYDAEWQVLNSKDFGIPQNRERVFIIGHLRGERTRKILPIRGTYKTPSIQVIGTTKNPKAPGTNFGYWVHDSKGIVGALSARDYKQPKTILIKENVKKGYVEACPGDGIRLDHPNGTTGRGRIQTQSSPTLTTSASVGVLLEDENIRYLTPKEYWRLQGFTDEQFNIAHKVNSKVQLYKQAGNSVTVNVIYEIAKRLS
ncbi:DNA cytosine methyltransferase [Oceanobacillus sp. FSL W7-1309]|uniref:DNA cytosine methyltransferase n=1 Tax=Oceanobacillus sp. FSL W7-1309 TaxID=2954539 RepID=UPI0030F769F1